MRYRFRDCELDVLAVSLTRNSQLVPIEPQVFKLLLLLIENRHRVLSKDEILDEIWEGRIVSESALSSRLKSARRAVGDTGKDQEVIATLPKRGFRFIADIDTVANPVASEWDSASAAIGTELTCRIAVLPFASRGDHVDHHVVADGLTHDIITLLGRAGWLAVIDRGSAFLFRDGEANCADAGKHLNADYVLSGSLDIRNNRVRLRAVIADVTAGTEIWAEIFDRRIEEVFWLQEELAKAVAAAAQSQIEGTEQRKAISASPVQLDAWTAYHRGAWHMLKFSMRHLEHASQYFHHALELAPNSVCALSGMSFIHWQRAFLGNDAQRQAETQQALTHARKCVDINSADPQGHWALGRALLLQDDIEGSIQELELATELNPSSVQSLYALARSLTFSGDIETALAKTEAARSLSPFDPMLFAMTSLAAMNYCMLGEHAKAAPLLELALRQPNAHYHIQAIAAVSYTMAGNTDKAALHYRNLTEHGRDYSSGDYLRAFPYQKVEHRQAVEYAFLELRNRPS